MKTDVTIYYCRLCGLEQPASEVAAALEREFSLTCETREGFWGAFRINYGDDEVFNRWTSRGLIGRMGFGRTPTADEVVEMFREKMQSTNCSPKTR